MPPPTRGDVLRELLQAQREANDLQKEERVKSRAEYSALRKAIREGFQALGAKLEESGVEEERKPGERKPGEQTGPHLLAAGPPPEPLVLPLSRTEESASIEVRVDRAGVRAAATASPSWLRAHWKTVFVVVLFLWGGVNLVEKAVMLYHKITNDRAAHLTHSPKDAGVEEP